MTCPKCNSENVNTQVVSEMTLKTKHRGIIYWLFIAWWWLPIKWLIFTIPAIIVKLFRPKRYKTTTTHITKCVCQGCGNTWDA
ncbi:hypothetical protein [Parasporobacterium paucivorans]|uniref:Uncharacterized protein n=1 Tax=Parasporobacterium paucivorans DSM 15970 TaxID=1122934 RepID=A0A1M6B7Y3_9FIRM|nr:hypothetical protein [Parasporobacterium paucivorans]SHI44825.1 hypothetical protein SAMN02745691_00283 [Parasporobacterium paucivorans DSM 15970]